MDSLIQTATAELASFLSACLLLSVRWWEKHVEDYYRDLTA